MGFSTTYGQHPLATQRLRLAALTFVAAVAVSCTRSGDAAPVTADTLDAEGLVTRWIDSMGGMESWWQLDRARFTLTTEMYDAESGRLRRARPRYVTIEKNAEGLFSRIERWEGDDYIEQGWHPGGQWAVMNGEPLAEGDKDYDEADYVGGDVQYWIGLPFKLTDPGVNLDDGGTDSQGRRVVRVTFGEGVGDHQDTWHYYFDGPNPWPVQVDYQEAGKTNTNHTRWEDIQQTDGYFYVGRRVHFNEEGQVTKVIRTGDLEVNPDLDRSVFLSP